MEADVDYLGDIALAPDGSIFAYTGLNRNHIVKVDPEGIIHTYTGKDRTGANPRVMAALPWKRPWATKSTGWRWAHRAAYYFTLTGAHYPRATSAGVEQSQRRRQHNRWGGLRPHRNTSGDGGPARQARLTAPIDLVVGPDGSIYFSERAVRNNWKARAAKIDPNGIVTTVVGGGDKLNDRPRPWKTAACPPHIVNIGRSYGLAFGPDGTMYLAFPVEKVVLRLGYNSLLTRFAGNGQDDTVPMARQRQWASASL